LERYDTLQAAHGDLLSEQARLQSAVEAQRRQLAQARKAASTQLLTSESIISRMKERVETARALVARLQAGADDSATAKSSKTLELGQALQSVANLHARCGCSSHGAIIKHTAADAEALGYAVKLSAAAERLGMPSGEAGGPDGGSDDEGGVGEEAPGDGSAEGTAPAPAPASPARAGRRGSADNSGPHASPGAPPAPLVAQPVDITGMDPASLKAKVVDSIGQLQVVGAYVIDFQALADAYPVWQAEARRKEQGKW
jgi:hypothetical protein